MSWVMLGLAIVLEVTGTLSMRASEGFTRLGFTVLTLVAYLGAFTLLSMVLKQGVPVGVAYGIWAGAGVALVALFGRLVFGEPLTVVMWAGFLLIIAGVWLVETGANGS
ncbi:MAG TPA: multidrug efflux SMR transporter [Nocardioidaceae bacterium]|jgi:small multidrug resistance pump|nr:multidrug efflux SMR transporter [Nocardioidaceae bacterium]